DDVAIAPRLEPPPRGGLLLRLPLAVVGLPVLERGDALALLPEPSDLFGADVGIHRDAALGLLVANDHDTKLGAEGGQVAAVAPWDGYGGDRNHGVPG